MAKFQDLNRELEIAARNAIKKENESWQKINDELKVRMQPLRQSYHLLGNTCKRDDEKAGRSNQTTRFPCRLGV